MEDYEARLRSRSLTLNGRFSFDWFIRRHSRLFWPSEDFPFPTLRCGFGSMYRVGAFLSIDTPAMPIGVLSFVRVCHVDYI